MNQLGKWLCARYLPAWCREELLEENAKLREHLAAVNQEKRQLEAYIHGMETALRLGRRMQLHNNSGKKGIG